MHDIFAFTDIHGMYDLYKAIMDYCHKQDPEATIIFCGDACDRGRDGYKIMHELLDNPYVVYLQGNHEDMFCKAAREIKERFGFENPVRESVEKTLKACRYFDYKYAAIQNSLGNGGLCTLTDWVMDGMPLDFVERIENLPLTFSTDTMDFCHAAGVYRVFEEASSAEYEGKSVDEYTKESLIWSRSAFSYGWKANRTCVFGHTPIPYLLEDLEINLQTDDKVQPYKYVGDLGKERGFTGSKIDMDTGAAFLGYAYVLNCLTMKVQGFIDTDINNKEIKNHNIEQIEVIQL